MTQWNTENVVKLFDGLADEVEAQGQGGDVDTSNLRVSKGDYNLYICGFRHDGHIDDPDDTDVELVEVTDGRDSRGGCNSSNEDDLVFHARVVAKLRAANFNTVPSMDGYF